MAITQLCGHTAGRSYDRRKRGAGKSRKEALRWLNRRLSDVVYRRLVRDLVSGSARPAKTSPGRTTGATLDSAAG
jgi:hypothetical protein